MQRGSKLGSQRLETHGSNWAAEHQNAIPYFLQSGHSSRCLGTLCCAFPPPLSHERRYVIEWQPLISYTKCVIEKWNSIKTEQKDSSTAAPRTRKLPRYLQ